MRPETMRTTVDVRSDDAPSVLRAHGCRVTGPRVAVLRTLIAHPGPIDTAHLTVHAQEIEPSIHETTVYRTLTTLAEVGIVSHVHAGHGRSLVRLAGDDSVVAVCRECHAIVPIAADAIGTLGTRLLADTGFTLEPGHFALEGICATCSVGAQ
jgi:Fur family ferric uptake transcriptional regulator